jgi:hypothetical protein
MFRNVAGTARNAEAPGGDSVSGCLGDWVRLSRNECFIDFQFAWPCDRTVNNELIPRFRDDEITAHDLTRVNLALLTVANYGDTWAGEQRNVIQLMFCPDFLHDSRNAIDEDNSAGEEGINWTAQYDQRDAQSEEQPIEHIDEVGVSNLPIGPTCRRREDIAFTSGAARLRLRFGQTPDVHIALGSCER